MDLEEFRRAYMQSESLGNTPKQFIKRTSNFFSSLVGIGSAIKHDSKLKKKHEYNRQKAHEKFKNGNFKDKVGATFEMLDNSTTKFETRTDEAIGKFASSTVELGKSLNELGSTAERIVGNNRSNQTYDDQDFEKGMHFALMATGYLGKAYRLPKNTVRKSKRLAKDVSLVSSSISAAYGNNKSQMHQAAKDISRNVGKATREAAENIGKVASYVKDKIGNSFEDR